MKAKLSLVTLVTALTLTAGAASAGERTWKVGADYMVRLQDLDLARSEDRARLLDRVERAT